VLGVNLTGYFNLLKAVVPSMRDGGSIVLIASHTGRAGYRYPAYTSAKGAIIALARQLARELGPRRIRVNTVSPGVIVTDLTRERFGQPQFSEPVVSQTPLGRLGEPDDVAKVVLFFASDLSSHVDAVDLLIDGGMTSTMYF
jgi:NAD(P)-dependent dehydrogenase (short-subunit alcohol dehydrogenase family)